MTVFILNSGSSSIKYQLIEMPKAAIICSGMIDRIGSENSNLTYSTQNNTVEKILPIANHSLGLKEIALLLMDSDVGVIQSTKDIAAVGHRVVHGGNNFKETTIIDDTVKAKIKELFALAPLHNPANYEGIIVASQIFENATQVAVFDTAFHQTIPVEAHKYALPNYLYTDHKIRVYGFHGTSHKYVSEQAINFLKKANKIITIHLGNGCSMTAIKDGKSIDTSLGFGPMNGLIMGTRSGDVDQSVVFHLVNSLGYSLSELNTLLQKQSGMLGLTGFSDLRDIQANAEQGNKDCQLALLMNAYRIKKYIGAYVAALGGLDAIIFTAGIGENSAYLRKLVCTDMAFFGIEIDDAKNEIRSKEIREINIEQAKIKVLVIPTNEEIEIASQVYELLS